MKQPVILIDTIEHEACLPKIYPDLITMEWFENKRRKLIRETQAGLTLELRLPERHEWQHGDRLYHGEKWVASICFKPCLTIIFTAKNKTEAADFCYYIGNRHLPIFSTQDNTFKVSYDGRLYEQLSRKYQSQVQLVDTRLLKINDLRNAVKN